MIGEFATYFAFEIYLPLAFVIYLNRLPSASLPQVSAQNMAGVQSNIRNVNDKSIFAGAIGHFYLAGI